MQNFSPTKIVPAIATLLVKIQKPTTEKNSSGFFLGEAKDLPVMGEVISIGNSPEGVTAPAKAGETVLFEKYSVNTFVFEREEYRFIRFDNVLGKIKNK